MKKCIPILMLVCIVFVGADVQAKKSSRKLDTKLCTAIVYDDGDSFTCDGEQIRVLGIDTPEIRHPDHGISIDQPKGKEAAAFTKRFLEKAKRVVIVRGGKGYYGRTLAHVLADGNLLGVALIQAGLAYENVSRYGDNGLPEFAFQITEAWKALVKKPTFQNPANWRKKNQKKIKK